jgi:NADPH2:quinone reductase
LLRSTKWIRCSPAGTCSIFPSIGTAGKAASLELLHQLDLDGIIDHSKQDVVKEIMRITGGKGADVVYDSTGAQSSYVQSAAVVAAGGEYIRLGTAMQLRFGGSEDVTPMVEGRGAKMLVADLARYAVEPQYQAQMWKVVDGEKQALKWYAQGKVKPYITEIVSFDAMALQQAFDAFTKGINNVGKVVVQCGH